MYCPFAFIFNTLKNIHGHYFIKYEYFFQQSSFFTEIREIVHHEDLPYFDQLIYKRGNLLDKLLRRGSDMDYLFRHQAQNLRRRINHGDITSNSKYSPQHIQVRSTSSNDHTEDFVNGI